MLKSIYVFLFFLIINKLKTKVKCEDLFNDNINMIKYCLDQGYNIQDPNDIFFNDICSIFYSKNKKDVSLEYRRKYYYYPNYEKNIMNETTIEKIFPNFKRNSIFSCFKHHLTIKLIPFNLALYIITILFFMQMTSFISILIKRYNDSSENSAERYHIYLDNQKKKLNNRGKSINKNLKLMKENNNEKKINNAFIPLKEENNPSNRNEEEHIDTSDNLEDEQIQEEKQIESKDFSCKNKLNIF